jgi:competence protein ComEC
LKKFISDKLIYLLFGTLSLAILFFPEIFIKQNSQLVNYANYPEDIEIFGLVISEPDTREFNTRVIIQIEKFKIHNQEFYPKEEKALLILSRYSDINYADKIIFYGKPKKPENFYNENGLEFDYVNFLAKDNIYTILSYPKKIEIIKNHDFNFTGEIFKIKQNFIFNVKKIIPSPESELLGGILLGIKTALGQEIETAFRRVGLIHIVVLSGYNVTIIAEAILRSLFFLPQIFSVLLGSFFIIIFSIMVGSGATVIRASIMAILALVARLFYQKYNVNKALFLAGFVMLLQNPKILLHDPSFQLSFLATFGLINFGKKMDEKIKFITSKFNIKELTIATVSTQIAVLPLLVKMTGEVSVISLPVNLIVLPTIPFLMLTGFLSGVFSFINIQIFNWIANLFGYVTYFGLKYIIEISLYFSNFDFAVLKLLNMSNFKIFLIYGLIIIFLYFRPIQIFKKVLNIIWFAGRLIIKNK